MPCWHFAMDTQKKFETIVVGSGNAGLCAAIGVRRDRAGHWLVHCKSKLHQPTAE
jgi:succinate dehydrogenase/fumarate reductase flavoprotein subunit